VFAPRAERDPHLIVRPEIAPHRTTLDGLRSCRLRPLRFQILRMGALVQGSDGSATASLTDRRTVVVDLAKVRKQVQFVTARGAAHALHPAMESRLHAANLESCFRPPHKGLTAGDKIAPYWLSVTTPCARLRFLFTSTISRAEPRVTSDSTHAEPTAPAPMIPIFISSLYSTAAAEQSESYLG
jgi:hypothetical protein